MGESKMRTKATALACVAAGVLLIAACTTPTTPGTGGPTTNLAPLAVLTATPTAGTAPLTVEFSAALSTDPDGTIVSYLWNFGDGTTSTDAETSHDYDEPGSYTVTLRVTDDGGLTSTDVEVIEVSEGFDSVVLVDDAGTDSETCGDLAAPCASIAQGIARAGEQGKSDVYVAEGSYGAFDVVAGVNVTGGYADGFQGTSGTTEVTGSFHPTSGVSAAIRAAGVSTQTRISRLTVRGADESAQGRPAYAVHVAGTGAGLRLEGMEIHGGESGTAATGVLVDGPSTVGIDASNITSGTATGAGNSAYGVRALSGAVVNISGGSVSADDGIAGAAGGAAPAAPGAACNGAGGGNAGGPSSPGNGGGGCAGNSRTQSGAGGRGGDYSGSGSAGASVNGALGGNGGCGSLFGCGTDAGGGGAGSSGAAGAGGTGGNAAIGGTSTYLGSNGTSGSAGGDGTGGAGGGGGKSASASGGGGGAGGGGGTGGAAATIGGSAGGGSFGVYGSDASLALTGVVVIAGSGGNGGAGQAGGPGAAGGSGGGGGTRSCCLAGGGGGGGGGAGGAGGGGAGGGAAGPSVAVLHRGTGSLTISGASLSAAPATIGGAGGAGGIAGAGGAGGSGTQDAANGSSAPAGNAGTAGSVGAVGLSLGSWDNGVTTEPSNETPTTTTSSTTTTVPAATTTYTPVSMTCQTTASGQTRVNAHPTGATVKAPTTVQQGSTFQVELTPDPMSVPTSGEGYPISWIANLNVSFLIPAGTTFVSASTSGGSNLGSGAVSAAVNGDDVRLTVPGQLSPGTTAVLPKVTVTLQATGAVGTNVTTKFGGASYGDPGTTFQTRVTGIPLLGSVTSNSNCYAPTNPVLSTTAIVD